jgi:hypothetical protein
MAIHHKHLFVIVSVMQLGAVPEFILHAGTNMVHDSISGGRSIEVPHLMHLSFLNGTHITMQLSHCLLLLCLANHHWKKGRAIFKHSHYRKYFFKSLSIKEGHCRYQKSPQSALILLKLSHGRNYSNCKMIKPISQ